MANSADEKEATSLSPAARPLLPLAGLRVLDLTSTIAGAVATMLLAGFGADVTSVQPVEGHPLRHERGYPVWSWGKATAVADMRAARGRERVRRLVAGVDILVDDCAPGELERLRLAPETLRTLNPRLIHASITAAGTAGPWRDVPADESLIAALTGIMRRQPGFRVGPQYFVLPLCSYAAALLAIHGVGAALVAGATPGHGPRATGHAVYDTITAARSTGSSTSTQAAHSPPASLVAPCPLPAAFSRVETSLVAGALAQEGAVFVTTERPQPFDALTRLALGALPLYRLYQTRDGRWVHLGGINARFWPNIALAVGRPELISDPRFQNPPRMANNDNRRALIDLLAAEFDRRPFAEWDRILDEHDVPYAPAQTVDEFLDDPQVRQQGLVVSVEHPELGTMERLGPVIAFGADQLGARNSEGAGRPNVGRAASASGESAAPSLNAAANRADDDTTHAAPGVPRSAAEADDDLSAFRLPRCALEGVRIIDISGYIAGAYGGAFLADLGADVIKVEGPDGDGLRGLHGGFLAWNRGKRGVCLNLRTDAGREAYLRLCAGADVVLENMRPGVADRLGVGYDAVRARNPRIIYCYVSAYGSSGPYRHKPGVDPLMQARSGIERAQGGLEHPPVFLVPPVTDNTTAMLNAAGIVLALYQRERTGEGQFLETSLLASAGLLQSDAFTRYEGRPPRPVNDRDHTGPGPLRRLYQCRDGWLMLVCRDEREWRALCAALRRPEWRDDPRFTNAGARADHARELTEVLAERFAGLTLDGALRALGQRRVPAVTASGAFLSIDDPHVAANGYAGAFPHPILGQVRQGAGLTRVNGLPVASTRPAPLLGEHTREVLAEASLSAAEIDALLASGAALDAAPAPTT